MYLSSNTGVYTTCASFPNTFQPYPGNCFFYIYCSGATPYIFDCTGLGVIWNPGDHQCYEKNDDYLSCSTKKDCGYNCTGTEIFP